MPTIVVEVMPKAELLDPAGKAVAGALHRLGHESIRDVRIGKRFELHVDGEVDAALLARAQQLAADILSNGVIEDVISVHVSTSSAESADGVERFDAGVAGETR